MWAEAPFPRSSGGAASHKQRYSEPLGGPDAQDGQHCAARDFGGGARYVDELLVQTGEVSRAPGGGLTQHNPPRRAYEEVRQESCGQNCSGAVLGAFGRPNWRERPASESLTGWPWN